jgi:hypothetical protein
MHVNEEIGADLIGFKGINCKKIYRYVGIDEVLYIFKLPIILKVAL